jgi:hypothetical protein
MNIALESGETGAIREATHVISLVETHRDARGSVVALEIADPDTYTLPTTVFESL